MPRSLYPAPLTRMTVPTAFLLPAACWLTRQTLRLTLLLTLVTCSSATGLARDIFVNNQTGIETLDGSAPEISGVGVGPVRSIRRALLMAELGDTIVLANTGVPYYEMIVLNGRDHSGYDRLQFTIEGNGATISGVHAIPRDRWRYVGGMLWRFEPRRKGFAVLVRKGRAVPRVERPSEFAELHDLPAQHWTTWTDGTIYYKATPLEYPSEVDFACAQESVGLSLYRVRNVRIANLTFRHFRVDGINAFDGCENVVLENITSRENGRRGLSVLGDSQCRLNNCRFEANGVDERFIGEFAVAADLGGNPAAPP